MAELNLKQIEDKLNQEFEGEQRSLVFWYDDAAEFKQDIESLNLKNAKIHRLNENNLFKTKVLLEREDTESNYLLYAPYPKPASRDNHLADTINYSKEFSADRATLLAVDLGIDEKYKNILQKHIRFFGAKDRTNKFYRLEVNDYNGDLIEIAILSVLVNSKIANFEEVVRIVLTTGDLKDNQYLNEFQKYDIEEAFWKHVRQTFAYIDEDPSLEKFVISLFLTYIETVMNNELPNVLNSYILSNSGTVIAFMDQMMNNRLYHKDFDHLSAKTFQTINGEKILEDYSIEDLIHLDIFKYIDQRIIDWMIDRLLDENLNSTVADMSIPELCRFRETQHFGDQYYNEYHLLRHAYHILNRVNYEVESDLLSIIEQYDQEDYIIDTHYRKFYYYLDQVGNQHLFDDLQVLVENIYTNKYLDVLMKKFNNKFSYEAVKGKYKLQRDFYSNFVEDNKEMTVVIISDAFRYEVAKELVKHMERDQKFESVEIEPQIGVVPSYTSLGMAALLPHKELTLDEERNVLLDQKPSISLVQREAILKHKIAESGAIQYDDLKKYTSTEMREFFVGKQVVYIYHNQIDARGDKLNTEDEVFIACKEAIDEIKDIIIRITDSVSRTRYVVTADHGFIYKRDKMQESDKIERFSSKGDQINKRFIVSEKEHDVIGTTNMMLSEVLGNNDYRIVTTPVTSNIFKSSGGGQNFVHGGSSPQEILVPVIQVKTVRGKQESENVKIALISMVSKVTALNINLDLIQQEPIGEVMQPTSYRISFVDKNDEVISNEEIHYADSKQEESAKRIFKLNFNLRDQKYDRDQKYFLVARDAETGIEAFRHEVMMDIAFAGGFGFDI